MDEDGASPDQMPEAEPEPMHGPDPAGAPEEAGDLLAEIDRKLDLLLKAQGIEGGGA